MTARRGWVLVTGASRGIGAATAVALAARRHDVVLWARSAEDLAATADRAAALGARVRTAEVDVRDGAQVERAAADSLDGVDRLAGLVLNAGYGRWAPVAESDPVDWARTLATNLDGPGHVLRAVLPRVVEGGGLVVGMLSDGAAHPFPGRGAYCASKAGLAALLEVLRREVRARRVRVTSLVFSRVDTHFQGSHEQAGPGTRPGALTAAELADVVASLFELPPHIEIRQVELAAMTSDFGPFPERVAL